MARTSFATFGSIAILVIAPIVARAQEAAGSNPQNHSAGWSSAPEVLDLNTATRDQLTRFRGIGLQYADKIIRGRPYQARSELVSRDIIPVTLYLRIKHQLYAANQTAAPPVVVGSADADLLDVNHASVDELRSFKGIGQMWADKIAAGRPYKAAIELVGRHVMPLSAYQRIEAGIVARP